MDAYGIYARDYDFNPRSPRGGATLTSPMMRGENVFQSTLPTRGSDQQYTVRVSARDISIHAPHEGERRPNSPPIQGGGEFQSTLPTRGSDLVARISKLEDKLFQSTLPTRGSDDAVTYTPQTLTTISIHAPHEGERRSCSSAVGGIVGFQSTLPTRGSDNMGIKTSRNGFRISIHAPHEGERPTPA